MQMRIFHESVCVGRHLGEKYVWDGRVRSPDEERAEVERAEAEDEMRPNRPYYLLAYPWYQAWRDHVERGGSRPPAINNTELVDPEHATDQISVRRGLASDYDYRIVPGAVWQRFSSWYGGGPEIKRLAIRAGTQLVVDLFPVEIDVRNEEHFQWTMSLASSNTFSMVRHW